MNKNLLTLIAASSLPFSLYAADPVAQPGGKVEGAPPLALVKVADGLVDPVDVTAPPDGSGRLFVCERHGLVRVIKDGKLLDKPALDIRDKTLSSFLEEGLFGVEFHPKFKENGKVYVLSLIHISEPTRLRRTWYAVLCLKKIILPLLLILKALSNSNHYLYTTL